MVGGFIGGTAAYTRLVIHLDDHMEITEWFRGVLLVHHASSQSCVRQYQDGASPCMANGREIKSLTVTKKDFKPQCGLGVVWAL